MTEPFPDSGFDGIPEITLDEALREGRSISALGLMSGTSLDGVDAAWIETDGVQILAFGHAETTPYPADLQDRLRATLGAGGDGGEEAEIKSLERELTYFHAHAARAVLAKTPAVQVVGFHGHTLWHRPDLGKTRQIGHGALLADLLGVTVVNDFRSEDMRAGGQGAPLVPVFHQALSAELDKPVAILNLGGVGNVTYLPDQGEPIAFDTGPGNALIDDWARAKTNQTYDEGGALALRGQVNEAALSALMDHPYFAAPPPKSLDRDAFDPKPVQDLTPEDGAATLTAFTALAATQALDHLPDPPKRWLICGGGRLNKAIMAALSERLGVPVEPVEIIGWDGDALEAQAFAHLAVRSLKGLPLTFPKTTGTARPLSGGRRWDPK